MERRESTEELRARTVEAIAAIKATSAEICKLSEEWRNRDGNFSEEWRTRDAKNREYTQQLDARIDDLLRQIRSLNAKRQ